MNQDQFDKEVTSEQWAFSVMPEFSEWKCYMFGNKPGGHGMVYQPAKGQEPNWFVRWMMKICFDCTWEKKNG